MPSPLDWEGAAEGPPVSDIDGDKSCETSCRRPSMMLEKATLFQY